MLFNSAVTYISYASTEKFWNFTFMSNNVQTYNTNIALGPQQCNYILGSGSLNQLPR